MIKFQKGGRRQGKTIAMKNGSSLFFCEDKSADQFNSLYVGEFVQDGRDFAIDQKLDEYYKSTPDSMGNSQAEKYYRAFSEWCKLNCYTAEEIYASKKRVSGRSKFI